MDIYFKINLLKIYQNLEEI